ncbi:MAG: 4-hydroxy-3-methylbut-2-enyl diphosphate reductase [Proteobacteria bacterium]|nr:4-hydroxy-3-methylbut-2-enyl diphosphate reductase [Pseudomonadota bacterium]
MKIILANPRGFCAGVDRAIQTVERALALFGTPLYVRHEIVHNKTVVEDFESRGVVFVEELADVPAGNVVIFSAHGVGKAVVAEAKARGLTAIDATCPLVTKVHMEAARFAREGAHILLIGHAGHVEVLGTLGQVAMDDITLIQTVQDAEAVTIPEGQEVGILTQTTLSVDETRDIMAVLKRRFPHIRIPKKDDICYATQNRQDAVKDLAKQADVVLVVGSKNSSNSARLREVALQAGVRAAYLIDGPQDLTIDMVNGAKVVGITAGASAPEHLVQALVQHLPATSVDTLVTVREDVTFQLPKEVR